MGEKKINVELLRFEVLPEHIKLLRKAIVRWEDGEFGAPAIDDKRPYGNSSVYEDIGEILGITPPERDGEFSDAQTEYMDELHKGTETALQIFLVTGEMKAGKYTADKYDTNWQLLAEESNNGLHDR